MSMNIGLPKQKNFQTQIPKKKIPALDFSNLRQVREYKDWYSYAKKLESAIKLLRERISDMEHSEVLFAEEKEEANERIQSLEANNRRLQKLINDMQKQWSSKVTVVCPKTGTKIEGVLQQIITRVEDLDRKATKKIEKIKGDQEDQEDSVQETIDSHRGRIEKDLQQDAQSPNLH